MTIYNAYILNGENSIFSNYKHQIEKMGSFFSKQVQRRKSIRAEKKLLHGLKQKNSTNFPGFDYHADDRKNWMSTLALEKLHVNQIIWPGTHDSATNKIGIPFISRPFARTQSLSIYKQLVISTLRSC